MALSTRLEGNESWAMKAKGKITITGAEVKLMTQSAKYTWMDH
jgi:hypothetical protein